MKLPEQALIDSDPEGSFTAYTTENAPGHYQVLLTIDGIHCAACIARIERAMQNVANVTSARLNFSTRRLMVKWQGDRNLAENLAQKLIDMGYHPHAFYEQGVTGGDRREEKFLLFCLGLSGFAMGNIMLLSIGIWTTDPDTMGMAMRDFLHWMSALIAIPAVAVAGQPFFRSAWAALSRWRTNMDVPISVGLILTLMVSLFQLINHREHAYFDSAVMLMFFLLVGRYLDVRVRDRARGAAMSLLQMMNRTATMMDGETPRRVAVKSIENGMTLLVSMGERIPADGVVMSGVSDVDLSMVTGETIPVRVQPGDMIVSGTLNMTAPLVMQATRDADRSFLSDIIRLMEVAEQGQAHYTRIADRAARLYTPVVHVLALLSFLGWTIFGGMGFEPALLIAATVLIITCPCALGLAVPVVQVVTVSRLMKQGILVKSGDALERLGQIDTVVFDKTGTITMGVPEYQPDDTHTIDDLKWAASLAVHSKHPLARALVSVYQGDVVPLVVTEVAGQGLSADTPDGPVRLGRAAFCGVQHGDDTAALSFWLIRPGVPDRLFRFMDRMRPDVGDTIQKLSGRGLTVHLLSGDTVDHTRDMARSLGVSVFKGGCTPKDKFDYVQDLTNSGHRVLMVGDGLNDAPVLSGAHVSMSPASAMDIAQTAADIVWTGVSLSSVFQVCDVSKQSNRLVFENFVLSIIYNIIAVPVAMAGYVTPLIAALAMSGSSLVVIANSFRLKADVRK